MSKYDIALSYAGEDDNIIKTVYKILVQEGLRVFYAPAKQHEMVGNDLVKFLYHIYRHDADYIAAFISKNYVAKEVPMREAACALAKNSIDETERLIPIYLDGTQLPDLDKDIVYFHCNDPIRIAALISKKLKGSHKKEAAEGGKKISIGNIFGDMHIGNEFNFHLDKK